MKIPTTLISLLVFLFSIIISPAQNKVEVPKALHGFWHFPADKPGDWDGSLIGANYVEFFYQLFSVVSIEKHRRSGFRLKLKNENGKTMELRISDLNGKQAKFQFSEWSAPKNCRLLSYPADTRMVSHSELPTALMRKWTIGNTGEVLCHFRENGQLFYNDREWKIIQAGHYLNKEYRLLIQSEDLYQMLYVLQIDGQSLRLARNLQQKVYTPMADNVDVYKILGNWANENSNAWKLGFFEDFAIYKGGFWNYKTLKFNGTSANIVLNRGSLETRIQLQIENKKLCEIAINDKPAELFFKCEKNLPAFAKPDSSPFAASQFQKVDTATITGYFRNNPFPKPFSVSFMDPLKDDHVEYFADLDSLGRFILKIPLYSTIHAFVDWGRMTKMDVIEPGENYFLFFDFSDQQHLFMGDNERLHNEVAAYETFNPNRNMSREDHLKIKNLESMDFLRLKKIELQNSEQHLTKYMEENPFVSTKFKYFVENYYRFGIANDLMQRRFKLDRRTKEKFPTEFLEYVSNNLYQNKPVQPNTLVREYLWFMRDYIGYFQDLKDQPFATSTIEPILYLEQEGRLKLSGEERVHLSKWQEFYDLINSMKNSNADSAATAGAAKPYAKAISTMNEIFQRESVQSFMKQEWPDIVRARFVEKDMELSLAQFDELIADSQLKDIFEARNFYGLIDHEKKPLSEKMMQIFQERVTTPVFVATIEKLNRYYSQLNKQDIFYTESLKNTDHLKDAEDADALFRQLTEPYRGKVIYIDFWGSWCGPCKKQMPYVAQVKAALKDKEVIFMYFANNSPETAWKNTIKEHQLSGENVVHYRLPNHQQAMIERRLSINSFPTYLIMDKQGNVVNMNAPQPQEHHRLIQEISKLL